MADAETQSEVVQGPTRAGRDRGFSMVEVVVTITLMAVVLVPIMTAVATSIKSSSVGRSAAQVETALVNAVDQVNRAPRNCSEGGTGVDIADVGYTGYVLNSLEMQGWTPLEARASATVRHAYYLPDSSPDWVDGVCEPGTAVADNVQRVIISITSRDGKIQRKIEVVKSRV